MRPDFEKKPYSVLIQDVIKGFHRNSVLFILVLLESVVLKLRVNQYVSSLITYTKIPTLHAFLQSVIQHHLDNEIHRR